MTGPKHLWSGDWEREAEKAAEDRADLRPPQTPSEEQASASETDPGRALSWRPTVRQAVASLAVLLLVAVGVVLAVTLPGSSSPGLTAVTQPAAPAYTPSPVTQATASPPVNQPSVEWLGMQIVTTPLGAVVTTVTAGGIGDTAGLSPGDVITQIGGSQINSASQIRPATAGIAVGAKVTIHFFRGSSPLTVSVPMRARPTIQP